MTSRERGLVLTALWILLGLWLVLRAIPGLVGLALAERSGRTARVRLLAETQAAIARLPAMEDSAKLLTAGVAAAAPRFLIGGAAPEALADLNARLTTLASGHHIRLAGFEPRPDSLEAGQARRVRAAVRLEADFRGLAGWLDDLERMRLAIAPLGLRVSGAAPFASAREPESLTAEIEVTAWYLAASEGP
jgi:hypothetical protein